MKLTNNSFFTLYSVVGVFFNYPSLIGGRKICENELNSLLIIGSFLNDFQDHRWLSVRFFRVKFISIIPLKGSGKFFYSLLIL